MAETMSMMLPLGTELPPFTLKDAVSGKDLRSTDLRGPKGTTVRLRLPSAQQNQ